MSSFSRVCNICICFVHVAQFTSIQMPHVYRLISNKLTALSHHCQSKPNYGIIAMGLYPYSSEQPSPINPEIMMISCYMDFMQLNNHNKISTIRI